jgi:DNA-directed RNA polymerase beta' subunit
MSLVPSGQSEKQTLLGVPRLTELLNATKDQKLTSCKIYFNKHHDTIEEVRETVGHKFVELTIMKISKSIEVCMNKKPESWYKIFNILYKDEEWFQDIERYEHCLSIKVNMDILYEYKLSLVDIAKHIYNEYDDLFCIFSPDNIGQLDIFVDTTTISLPEDRLLFIDKENAKEIYIEEAVQPVLEKMIIAGIQNIETVYYSQEGKEWLIETDGNNFQQILSQDVVDETRTISNNVWDIYETLGIEAAKQFLVEEFMNIMEGINLCHTRLLVDRMCFNGTISSISRYTMRSDESGPLGKISFEESLDILLKAGCNGEVDNMKGVSASIITGRKANIGTGMMDLHVDLKMISNFPFIKEVKEE